MRFSWFSALIGALAIILIPSILGAVALFEGYAPVNADSKPLKIEKTLAMVALHKTVDRLAPRIEPPIPTDDTTLTLGAHLYAQDCSTCHGAADGRLTTIAAGLYQVPPQFAKDGVDDDPVGETYWKLRHGIRFTGMPAFSATLSEKQTWAIALFLKHLPELDVYPHAQAAWKHMRALGELVPKSE